LLAAWAAQHHVELDFIEPGKPAQNAYIERLNRTYREEVLDLYSLGSLQEVRTLTEQWLHTYKTIRPHAALQGVTPTPLQHSIHPSNCPLLTGPNFGSFAAWPYVLLVRLERCWQSGASWLETKLNIVRGAVTAYLAQSLYTLRYGKRGGYREVPILREAREALTAYLEYYPGNDDPGASLWLGQRGPLVDRAAVKRLLDEYARPEGTQVLGPHQLRHTFATRFLTANPDDVRRLAALLGHSSLNTVIVYSLRTADSGGLG
jgi:hypothetical protein